MNGDRRGIDLLRKSIETVAGDLESRPARRRRPARWPVRVALAAVAGVALFTVAFWALRPTPSPEVEILGFRIEGRPVSGIVLDDPAAGSWIVRPQIGGRPLAALATEGDRP